MRAEEEASQAQQRLRDAQARCETHTQHLARVTTELEQARGALSKVNAKQASGATGSGAGSGTTKASPPARGKGGSGVLTWACLAFMLTALLLVVLFAVFVSVTPGCFCWDPELVPPPPGVGAMARLTGHMLAT